MCSLVYHDRNRHSMWHYVCCNIPIEVNLPPPRSREAPRKFTFMNNNPDVTRLYIQFLSKTQHSTRIFLKVLDMAPVPVTDDYYLVLEVQQTATSDVITRSYRRLALKLHPDRNPDQDTTKAFQLVSHSYGGRIYKLFCRQVGLC